MNVFSFEPLPNLQTRVHQDLSMNTDQGMLWLDFERSEVAQAPEMWIQTIEQHTGTLIDEYHVADVLNMQHPSAFDLTDNYQILIFRKLVTTAPALTDALLNTNTSVEHQLSSIHLHTTPVAFIFTERALITVREGISPVFESFSQKFATLTTSQNLPAGNSKNKGIPSSPIDLSLKLLNALIDKYLDVRAPLTAQIEGWQAALLQEKKRFNQWPQLLRESVSLQKLESLCEEQIDALQELRDDFIDNQFENEITTLVPERRDLMLVRLNDLIEHASRVQKHASRLESALKSAVDLHFSASSNQTNETMRFLAVLTSVFAPLTLLTGVYGMNFDAMPGLHNPRGFWFLLIAMMMTTLGLLYYFQRHRIVNRSEKSIAQLLSGEMDA